MNATHSAQKRAYWLKTLHQWHWISSAICLLGMLLFAVTGLTLNNASRISARPSITTRQATLPTGLLTLASQAATQDSPSLPSELDDWVRRELDVGIADQQTEWSEDEIYVSMPRPGGDAWLSIDLTNGAIEYETTNQGWIAYLNDLHKGRHTGVVWSWFIDLFAIACLIFSLTGLVLLHMHAGHRAATWPMVGLGIVIPVVLALLFIH